MEMSKTESYLSLIVSCLIFIWLCFHKGYIKMKETAPEPVEQKSHIFKQTGYGTSLCGETVSWELKDQ